VAICHSGRNTKQEAQVSGLADYYTLGGSGLRVSRLAFGAMTFGTEWGWGADKDTARRMTHAYLDAGGNFIDTADLYTGGTSEKWVGEFVTERGARDKVVIATKFSFNGAAGSPNTGGNGRKNMLRAVEGSLKRLGTDYVDLYILHVWDRITPVEEVMRAFEDLVRAGKIRHAGLSNTPAWYASRGQAIAELRGTEPICALQLEYNLRERSIEHEFADLGAEHGMGLMVWGPLGAGLLSGKYRPGKDGATGDGRLEMMKANPASNRGMVAARDWEIIAELEAVAKELGRSMAQVAINWVTNRPAVGSVILGATKLAQLEDNIGALSFSVPPELAKRLDGVSAPPPLYPYSFFTGDAQSRVHGGTAVSRKPDGYYPRVAVPGSRRS
jgi:aryl-alcohol dehydrogenase-like predicted oxidoreductase